MTKRTFLKTTLKATMKTTAAAALSSAIPGADGANPARKNWAGNYTYQAPRFHAPKTVDEIRAIVRGSAKVKALGARHSFNNIADSAADQISLENFQDIAIDAKARTVTAGAGVKYGQLAPVIDKAGFAVHNLASLPHVSMAGACATGTHGSGSKNGNLSTAVAAMEMVTADGQMLQLSRAKDGERFAGAVVALGALGVITRITLDLVPRFDATQVLYQNLSFAQLEHNLEAIFGAGYSVSLFTDWQKRNASEVWIKSVAPATKTAAKPDFYGAKAAVRKLHPIVSMPPENCTDQLGVPGPWYERLPHFKMNFTPSSGDELQSEYFVPRNKAYAAISAVESLRDQITPHLLITEFRTIAADNLWLSECYQRDSLAIHFTWKPEWDAVRALLPRIEEKLAPFEARPHWAKLFTMPASRLAAVYPKMAAFRALAQQLDPKGKFRNEYLDRNIFA